MPVNPAVTVPDGNHLFVAVRMAGTSPKVLCLSACSADPVPDRNYWSNGNAAPYKWVLLKSFGTDLNYEFRALGKAP